MCARFVLAAAEKVILAAYAAEMEAEYKQNWNIAVTNESFVITADKPHAIQSMHFGIIPWTSQTGKLEKQTFNSKTRNLLTSKIWRPLFEQHKRCLVLSTGFYEWKKIPNETSREDREPYLFTLKDRPLYAYAGLWSQWRDPETKEPYRTFSIVTTESNDLVGEVHDKHRMPVILSKENEDLWLSKDISPSALLNICVPFPDELMNRVRVSKRINAVNKKKVPNNDEGLILPENSL
ncbi:SOS response-associated peptidase [Mucilaginibacter terrenus]|uniref:Abasic site processing protein n=1 Tax=Mucilaginibacter terrenus TaxID=2482727 RepID=A0A3E2NVX4_9SPHI|nr:SOS response-associated peptidase [Mucilaginibacter terrenus]RFZ85168.1 SOS response-associated peptidase [Mucilaginibacter terrenus]